MPGGVGDEIDEDPLDPARVGDDLGVRTHLDGHGVPDRRVGASRRDRRDPRASERASRRLALVQGLVGVIEASDTRPTDQSHEVFKELSGLLDVQVKKMDATLKTELARVNAALKREKIAPIDPDAKPAPAAPQTPQP